MPTLAAIDLGSNSFHMIIARVLEHDIQILDRLREPVRLAAGLDDKRRLSQESQDRAIECLERFGQRLRSVPDAQVRAVATNTLRRARNARDFAERARAALGTEIEVVSGLEEARLIYLGVTQSHATGAAQQLVVDIGGGSTEVILGKGFDVLEAHSLYLGCVGLSAEYFDNGTKIDRDRFRKAETAAGLELQPISRPMRTLGWEAAVGASGTAHAIANALRENGWEESGITLAGMKKLRKALVRAGSVDGAGVRGIQPAREPVLCGGLAILITIFKHLGVEKMSTAAGALREGVLYDFVGRLRHEDIRDRTIRRFTDQYHADRSHAERVERTALNLLAQLRPTWKIDMAEAERLLRWATRLHEIGLEVSHTGFHKHGAYLIQHSTMPGFAADDQQKIAALVRGHRRKVVPSIFAAFPKPLDTRLLRLCVLLRLAVLLHRSRSTADIPDIAVDEEWTHVDLYFPAEWTKKHPLTVADLEREAGYLESAAIKLHVHEAPAAQPSR